MFLLVMPSTQPFFIFPNFVLLHAQSSPLASKKLMGNDMVSRSYGLSSGPLFLSIMFFVLLCHAFHISAAQVTSNAHDELSSRGFPIGLLPDRVLSYGLEPDGKFEVRLDGGCHFTIPNESYPASYASTITGVLKYGAIKELDGITVKAFYKWWTITGIHISGSDLVFEVGLVSVSYPASNFDETPACKETKKLFHSKS